MTDQIVIKGYWWLPAKYEDKIAGILTYIPDKSITLELIGQFNPNSNAINEVINRKTENVIYGYSSDSKQISLINCNPAGFTLNFNCTFPIQRYNCQHLVIGTHVESLETTCFFKAHINIPFLSLWATPNSIRNSMSLKDKECQKYNISFDTNGNNLGTVKIDDYELSLIGSVNYYGRYFDPQILQETFVCISKEDGFSLKDIIQKIFLFEQFLSLATLSPLESNRIILFDKSKFQQLESGKKIFSIIEYIRVFHGKNIEKSHDLNERTNFLFTYDAIKPFFNSIIQKWYAEHEDIAPIRHHLIECISKKGTFSSTDFLVVIQAIEGFWWRFRDEDYKRQNNIPKKNRGNYILFDPGL